MSGPKISVYSLSPEARANALEQLRCQRLSLSCAMRIGDILKELSSFSGSFDRQLQNIQMLATRTGQGLEQVEKLNHLQETLKQDTRAIEREFRSIKPHASRKIKTTAEALRKKKAEMEKLQSLRKRAEDLKRAYDEVIANDHENTLKINASILQDLFSSNTETANDTTPGLLTRINGQNMRQIQHSIIDDLNGVYSFDPMDEAETADQSVTRQKAAIGKALATLIQDQALPPELLKDIRQAQSRLQTIAEKQRLATFEAITVKGLFKKADAYRLELRKKRAEYDELFYKYRSLCEIVGGEAKELPFSNEAIARISAEIERLKVLQFQQQEQAYISECIDEVMSEMGYDLIGTREVRKKSGKQFRNELFTFNEGAAVNVTYSSDGQISMELGGIAREDRLPTNEETEALTRDMESFCGEFAVFEAKLRERGVIVGHRIALSPPSAEYAAIINVNDYDINASARFSELNAQEKRRKASEKKVQRRDD